MIDTHAHFDALADDPAAVLCPRPRGRSDPRDLTVGSAIDSCRAAVELAEREDGVYAASGSTLTRPAATRPGGSTSCASCSRSPRAVAVGETGLDHYRDYAPHDRQQELFDAAARPSLPSSASRS